MMKEDKRGTRTESLSLRIDPKTKFALEFMVKITGYRITDLIERAIKDYADKTTVGEEYSGKKNWLHYWHPDEGVRTIKMIFDQDIHTTFEEDEIAEFVNQHNEFFFFDTSEKTRPAVVLVQVLWPRIRYYIEHWREHKGLSRWLTGTLMLEAITAAGMRGPNWPRVSTPATTPPTTPQPAAAPKGDLDDEIPF